MNLFGYMEILMRSDQETRRWVFTSDHDCVGSWQELTRRIAVFILAPGLAGVWEFVRVILRCEAKEGARRCEAAGSKKPEAYSLEYVEDCVGPRTTQMLADRLPQ